VDLPVKHVDEDDDDDEEEDDDDDENKCSCSIIYLSGLFHLVIM